MSGGIHTETTKARLTMALVAVVNVSANRELVSETLCGSGFPPSAPAPREAFFPEIKSQNNRIRPSSKPTILPRGGVWERPRRRVLSISSLDVHGNERFCMPTVLPMEWSL
jgi:hypothetical protein